MLYCLTLLHSEWPKLYGALTVLSAIGLRESQPPPAYRSLCTNVGND